MIFVTVGSQKFQFNRLLQAVDELVENGTITEEVYAQSGACDYIPKHYKYEPFLDREQFAKVMGQCDLVITHGGTGTIVNALKAGKKVIAVPRLEKYGEHVDDHQLQLIAEFLKNGFISSCEDMDQLANVLSETRTKQYNKYVSNTQRYLDVITEFIETEFS